MDESQQSGVWPAYKEPSKNWPLICGYVLAMIGLVVVLVYMMNRMNQP